MTLPAMVQVVASGRSDSVVVSTLACEAEDPRFESWLGRKNVYTMNLLGICLSLGTVHYLGIGRSTGD